MPPPLIFISSPWHPPSPPGLTGHPVAHTPSLHSSSKTLLHRPCPLTPAINYIHTGFSSISKQAQVLEILQKTK